MSAVSPWPGGPNQGCLIILCACFLSWGCPYSQQLGALWNVLESCQTNSQQTTSHLALNTRGMCFGGWHARILRRFFPKLSDVGVLFTGAVATILGGRREERCLSIMEWVKCMLGLRCREGGGSWNYHADVSRKPSGCLDPPGI